MSAQDFKDLIESDTTNTPAEPDSTLEVPSTITEAFEHTMTDLAPTTLERGILESSLQGLSVSTTSFNLGIPESHVRAYLRRPQVKKYIKELKEAINEIDQMMITGTLRKMVGDRIDKLDEDQDYADLSRKDTLDIIKVFSEISQQVSKGQEKEKEGGNVFQTIYNQIL